MVTSPSPPSCELWKLTTALQPCGCKKAADVFFPAEAPNDFSVAMQGIIYLVTKYGFIHLYYLESGICLYMNHISSKTIFRPYLSLQNLEAASGIVGVNKRSQVLSISFDEQATVPCILNMLNNTELAVKLVSRTNLRRR